jgi:hypothetical protein
VFEFFNSSVGMWLLSSVVLTGGAALLQNIQHNHEVAQQNRQQLSTHRFEITHRLDQMEYGLRRAKTVSEAKAAMDNICSRASTRSRPSYRIAASPRFISACTS